MRGTRQQSEQSRHRPSSAQRTMTSVPQDGHTGIGGNEEVRPHQRLAADASASFAARTSWISNTFGPAYASLGGVFAWASPDASLSVRRPKARIERRGLTTPQWSALHGLTTSGRR